MARQSTTSPISITYTDQLSPTQPIDGYEDDIRSFNLVATDVQSKPIQLGNVPFTLTLFVNSDLIDNWDKPIGLLPADEEVITQSVQATQVTTNGLKLVLVRWNETTQSWSEIASNYNGETLVAHANNLGEFALLVKRQNSVYLPLITK